MGLRCPVSVVQPHSARPVVGDGAGSESAAADVGSGCA